MSWRLVVTGILMGIVMIMLQVRSPMLVAVGMYLPLDTTLAIFVGGLIRWFCASRAARGGYNAAQRTRVENIGILIASGLIAGEALVGVIIAGYVWAKKQPLPTILPNPSYLIGLAVLAVMAWVMVYVPLRNAGSPDEPAPPAAMMY